MYGHHRGVLTEIWKELRQFDGRPDEELPRLILLDAQREYIDKYYEQMLSFISLTQPDKDLRAPILRSRLNLYRMLMIIAVLRRHEELGTAEGLFSDQYFTITEEDLRWGLSYIFYSVMQTSALYNRLRKEEKEEESTRAYISALAFLHMMPHTFTANQATVKGEELGIKRRAVHYKLRTLLNQSYIENIGYGKYRKLSIPTRRKAA